MAGVDLRLVVSQAGFELRTMLSNGEQLLLNLALPLAGLAMLRQQAETDRLGQLVLYGAVFASNFTGTAIATAFERRQGSLKAFAVTPLGKTGLVLAKSGAGAALATTQLAVLLLLAHGFSISLAWSAANWLAAIALAAAAQAWALWLAAQVRAEAVLAVANGGLIFAVFFAYQFPNQSAVLAVNPVASAAQIANSDSAWLLLIGQAMVGIAAASRQFRWD